MITAGRIVGFIDLGTNSARLLIARLFPDRTYQVITRRKEVVRCLCVLLGLAEGLDRSHMGAVEKVSLLSGVGSRVTLEIQVLHDPHLEVWGVEYHTKNFKKVFGKSLCVSILTNGELEGLQNKCYE